MSCFDGTGREWIARDNDDGTVTVTRTAQESGAAAKATTFERLTSELGRAKSLYEAAEKHYQDTKDKSTAELASARAQEARSRRVVYEAAQKAKDDYEEANPVVADAALRQMLEYWKGQTAKRQEAVAKLKSALSNWEAQVEAQRAKFTPTKDKKEFEPDDPTKDALASLEVRLKKAIADVDDAKGEAKRVSEAVKKIGYEPEASLVLTVDLDGPWLFV